MTTVPEPVASQRELDQLRDELHRLDDHGSRGVGVIQAQLTDLVKDLTELKVNVDTRFDAHQRVHDQDRRERISGRRWFIGTAIAGLTGFAAVIGLLVEVLRQVH